MKRVLPWVGVLAAVLLLLDVGVDHGPGDGPDGDPNAPLLQIVEMDLSDIQVSCTRPAACVDDYLGFLEAASERAAEAPAGDDDDSAGDPPGPVDAAGIGFLLDGLDRRELLVAERSNTPGPDGHELRLVFEDPWVGIFEAMLLLPHGDGPHPGVVVHLGRARTLDAFAGEPLGRELSAAGVAVLVLQPRGDDRTAQAQLEVTLLRQGFRLEGLRAYELLLLHKYLRWRPDIADRIGLMSEGGHVLAGDLAAAATPDLRVHVTDATEAPGAALRNALGRP